jgi:hypothetical protein
MRRYLPHRFLDVSKPYACVSALVGALPSSFLNPLDDLYLSAFQPDGYRSPRFGSFTESLTSSGVLARPLLSLILLGYAG